MKPHVAKGWQCSFCKRIYAHDEHGKRFAEACCLCRECKVNPSEYTGRGTSCKACHAAAELKSAAEDLEHAKERLERAQKNRNGALQ